MTDKFKVGDTVIVANVDGCGESDREYFGLIGRVVSIAMHSHPLLLRVHTCKDTSTYRFGLYDYHFAKLE